MKDSTGAKLPLRAIDANAFCTDFYLHYAHLLKTIPLYNKNIFG